MESLYSHRIIFQFSINTELGFIGDTLNIPKILIIGENTQAGTYILRIRLRESIKLKFGRFKKGKLILLPAGDYTYVGSALSEQGSTSLARRLVRHATRSGNKPPHAIREYMIKEFNKFQLGPPNPLPKSGKNLFWNIDYLLDLETSEIINIIAIRSTERLENTISEFLESNCHTQIIEKSLGANDSPQHTHILSVNDDDNWWKSIADCLQRTYTP